MINLCIDAADLQLRLACGAIKKICQKLIFFQTIIATLYNDQSISEYIRRLYR